MSSGIEAAADHPVMPRLAVLTARVTFALMAVGMFARTLRGDDPVFGFLWAPAPDGLDQAESIAELVSVAGAAALCACGATLLWPRTRLPLAFVALWSTLLMLTSWWLAPRWPALVPGEKAARWLGAIGILLWLPRSRWSGWIPTSPKTGEFLLRLAAAATFACHGLEALWHKGVFLDYLFGASHDLLGIELSQQSAEQILTAIGVVDLSVAGLVLAGRWPGVAGWMAFWGTITALARILHGGLGNWSEAALRAPNAGVPLVLMLAWMARRR